MREQNIAKLHIEGKNYMEEICRYEDCTGCTACVSVCPLNCISMKANDEGFLYPYINNEICINCGLCKNKCPSNSSVKKGDLCNVYSAKHINPKKQNSSASGGAFRAIAEMLIDESYYLYAAKYDENLRVIHSLVKDAIDLENFIGSKYVQSDMNNAISEIKDLLKNNKKVAFCGTPCQVAGLIGSVGKNDKLITMELICHGVPSPLFFRKYISYVESKRNKKISNVNFRSKDIQGWTPATLKIDFKGGRSYKTLLHNDCYGKAFSQGLVLRECCYQCKYKSKERVADITLGDYWNIPSSKYDHKGVSVILTNTEAGDSIVKKCNNLLTAYVDINSVIEGNPRIISSITRPQERDEFFKLLINGNFDNVVKEFNLKANLKNKIIEKIPYKLRKIIGKA